MTRVFALTLLCVCQVLAMTLWFSASAVLPSLQLEFELNSFQTSLFTSGVQIGFVAGTLISALLGLADRLDPRRFFMAASIVAAVANGLILTQDAGTMTVPLLRFVTGMCMAGIYPVGMKMATSWAKQDMGLMVGLLVGALTLGSASPHLINAFGGVDWRFTIAVASACALAAALLINLVAGGSEPIPGPTLQPVARSGCLDQTTGTSREPGLFRPHVGTVRDVGLGGTFPRVQLRDDDGRRACFIFCAACHIPDSR